MKSISNQIRLIVLLRSRKEILAVCHDVKQFRRQHDQWEVDLFLLDRCFNEERRRLMRLT